ncbi:dihydroorotate dehydrogenase electron transfer subunit [Numidum massiliense]|uniref:dihydroorotate dehydrogenase electron transfer subunit n=1 Tax=Numidum massiliense TaxID=1522315 RepID=UPI000A9A78D1|nr:dihydroorotate dehydrogenase electron transfer subunit [Numidum massiliense]
MATKMVKKELTVLQNRRIASDIYQIDCHDPEVAHGQAPGQFYHIRCGSGWELTLRRPISIAVQDAREQTVTLIYRAAGKGTTWLASRRRGDTLDVLGPLGNGFPLTAAPTVKRALLVGGGVGVPPLYGLARDLHARGAVVDSILGFASREAAFYVDEFRAFGSVAVATDDGTLGTRGRVTDLIESPYPWDVFYACGPLPMLRALQQLFAKTALDGYVSLEERMGCGVGACLACVCQLRTQEPRLCERETQLTQVKICSDGPVFPFREVVL